MSVAYDGWLPALVNSQNFFTPCTRCSGHHSARESSLNFWDIDNKEELCSICLQTDPRDNVLQVRRSSYHDVVKVADIIKVVNISQIQSYVINGSKVLFLKRRPQPRPPKGAVGASQCVVCARHLQDVNLYCSLQCRMDGENGIVLDDAHMNMMMTSRNGGPDTPLAHSAVRRGFSQYSSGSDSDYQGESMMIKRRKTFPKRSPMM